MTTLSDTPKRYGLISRTLHWGMAALFAMQFLSAAAHWALPRENALREALWSYHATLGTTLLILVILRGIWGLMNISRRPSHSGTMGQAAKVGHIALYLLMAIVPSLKLMAYAGGTRGFTYLGIEIFSARITEISWMQALGGWHGELGWVLAFLVVGHIAMACIWHRIILRDDTLKRMVG
ncbi:cytochrome b [Yoonia maritima]|uniref:cytochrome b n=1 Tax=Yoonia maritima TaxID=1435347 RepID=UPI000D114660|nr:cytochrome b [Yoonia maritima]